jgi:hypothetical protein
VRCGTRGRSVGFVDVETISGLELCWKVDLAKCIDATPLVVDRGNAFSVYVGSHSGAFVCVDVGSGSEVWRRHLPDRIESSAAASSCGNLIFVGRTDPNHACGYSAIKESPFRGELSYFLRRLRLRRTNFSPKNELLLAKVRQ